MSKKKEKQKNKIIEITTNKTDNSLITTNAEQKKDFQYKSENLDLCLDLLRSEYSSESERSSKLDSKASIFLGVILTFMPFCFNYLMDYMYVNLVNILNLKIGFIETIIILAFICFIVTIICFCFSISARPSAHINLEDLNDNKILQADSISVKRMFIKSIYNNINLNRESNTKKALLTNCGIKCIFFAFLLFILIFIITKGAYMNNKNQEQQNNKVTDQEELTPRNSVNLLESESEKVTEQEELAPRSPDILLEFKTNKTVKLNENKETIIPRKPEIIDELKKINKPNK